jgi:alpha-ketoglutarate-dependent taurine dioxygenase
MTMPSHQYGRYMYLDAARYSTTLEELPNHVACNGLSFINTGEKDLQPQQVLDIARSLGTVMLAPRPSVRDKAHQGSIVSIKANLPPEEDETQQVFSTSAMPLHIDQSLTSPAMQPTHYLLGCRRPNVRGNGGDTVISFNQPILDALSPDETDLLRRSRQRILKDRDGLQVSGSTVISELNGKPFLSFWDAGAYGDGWVLDTPAEYTQKDASRAVQTLLDTALDPANARFIPWEEGRILVADNHASLHGRTAQHQPTDRELLHAKVLPS